MAVHGIFIQEIKTPKTTKTTLLRPSPEISYTVRKRGTYNAVLNNSGAAGDGVACMEHDGVGVGANGTSDIGWATFHRLVPVIKENEKGKENAFCEFLLFYDEEKKMEVEDDSYRGTCENDPMMRREEGRDERKKKSAFVSVA
ncbi:hypothetical protein VIGAN_08211300 [Vigna angularis var. angularis]|uniref:Uncharacterized protein n=1 Tax=Vigna angularis var. angularis TaxID=157739 RepID=A0A0S3SRE4_PHAAN|nr:hypothetical protein VIGAN_08211300 [Vigna angularis var. angularis]